MINNSNQNNEANCCDSSEMMKKFKSMMSDCDCEIMMKKMMGEFSEDKKGSKENCEKTEK